MDTLEINLSEPLRAFVDAQLGDGGYDSPSAFFEQLVADAKARREKEIDHLLREAIDSDKPRLKVTPELWEKQHKLLAERLKAASS